MIPVQNEVPWLFGLRIKENGHLTCICRYKSSECVWWLIMKRQVVLKTYDLCLCLLTALYSNQNTYEQRSSSRKISPRNVTVLYFCQIFSQKVLTRILESFNTSICALIPMVAFYVPSWVEIVSHLNQCG